MCYKMTAINDMEKKRKRKKKRKYHSDIHSVSNIVLVFFFFFIYRPFLIDVEIKIMIKSVPVVI